MFDPKLFRTSGHLGHYNENMYRLWTEDLVEKHEAEGKLAPGLREGALRAQADELPEPLRHLRRASGEATASFRGAWPTSGDCTATSAAASSTASRACGASAQDDAHVFCAEAQVAERDREVHRPPPTRCTGPSASRRSTSSSPRGRPPRSASAATRTGTEASERSRRGSRARRAEVRGHARRRGVLRAQDRVPRARRAQAVVAARHDPVRPEHAGAVRPVVRR